jgi:hypothetical protein
LLLIFYFYSVSFLAPEDTEGSADIKGIPGFWSQCLMQHPSTMDIITEEDTAALDSLTDITCSYDETYTSFTLHFHFSENDFFTNKVWFLL